MSPDDLERRRSQFRERDEPDELRNPTPLPLLVFAVLMVAWGVWYYFANTGFPVAAGDRRTPQVAQTAENVDGSLVYSANCVACHQQNGQGVAGVFPPLVASRWVLGDEARLVQIMLHGINGAIEVQGVTYQGVMPAFARLSDAELAAVTTHVRGSWGNDAAPISVETIAAGRERFPERAAAWAGGAELAEVFGDE